MTDREFLGEIEAHELPGMLRQLSRSRGMTATEGNACDFAANELERLTVQRDVLAKGLDDTVRLYNNLSDTGAAIFCEINEIAEATLGHPIETGHTAVYAVELVTEKLEAAEAEAQRWKGEHDARERCINSLNETIGSLESENRGLKGEVAELVKEVTDLREQLEASENEAERLKAAPCVHDLAREFLNSVVTEDDGQVE